MNMLPATQLTQVLSSLWVLGPTAFVSWIAVLLALKRAAYGALKRHAARTRSTWDDLLIEALHKPLLIAIFASGLMILGRVLPLSGEMDQMLDLLLTFAIAGALVMFIDRLTRGSLDRIAPRSPVIRGARSLILGGVRGLVIGLALLTVLERLGVSITPLLASLGVGSLAVALGLQDTLKNLFAGIYMVADKPIEAGQFVKLESGEEGYVVRLGWRSTWIRMLSNNVVVIPNSRLAESVITNYSLPEGELAVLVNVGVHYGSDLNKVESVTTEVAREVQRTVEGAVRDFEPFIRHHTFADCSINFTVIMRAQEFVASYLIKHELIKRLTIRYRSEGIVIPYPIRTLELPREQVSVLRDILVPLDVRHWNAAGQRSAPSDP